MQGVTLSNYQDKIQSILNSGGMWSKIVILQSDKDKPEYSGYLPYQAKFTEGKDLDIKVIDVPLDNVPDSARVNTGHIEMLNYADRKHKGWSIHVSNKSIYYSYNSSQSILLQLRSI